MLYVIYSIAIGVLFANVISRMVRFPPLSECKTKLHMYLL